ncbi:YncE family protein [Elusimicrobiota bacterium]
MKLLSRILTFFLPALSVWTVIFYFQYLANLDNVNDLLWFFLFAPAILLESVSFNLSKKRRLLPILPENKKERFTLISNIILWYLLFIIWIILLPAADFEDKQLLLALINTMSLPAAMHIFIAQSYLTFGAFGIWLLIYYSITIKRGKLRIPVTLLVPLFLTGILYYHFYYLGGIYNYSSKNILTQKGVRIVFSRDDLISDDEATLKKWHKRDSYFPRDIYIDKDSGSIYANYANTNDEPDVKSVTLIKIDIDKNEPQYFFSNYIKVFKILDDSLIVSPFSHRSIYILNKMDFSIIREIPSQDELQYWETLDILYSSMDNSLYILNDVSAAVLKYDYGSGRLLKTLEPDFIKYGGGLICPRLRKRSNRLYVLGYMSPYDVIELEPISLRITRKLSLGSSGPLSLGATALEMNDSESSLYVQDGGKKTLYEIDIETLKIKRRLKGDIHSRRIYFDKKRNALYIAGFFRGRLKALDLKSGKTAWTVRVGGKPYGIALDHDNDLLYVNSCTGIVRLDLDHLWSEYNMK